MALNPSSPPKQMTDRHPTAGANPVVLIVEDERGLADIYAQFIKDVCEVRVAYDGDETLEYIDHDLDIALLDRRLKKWTGDELVNVIRERGIDCGIIMVTAVSPDVDIVDLPADGYLTKPVRKEDLQEAVEEALFRLVGGADRREFLALLSRKIALEGEINDDRLEETTEYNKLQRRIDLAENRLNLGPVPAPSKYRPDICPACNFRWDVSVDGTVGYLEIATRVWKCLNCGNSVSMSDPSDRSIARR